MNVYQFNDILVSPISSNKAITQKGEVIPIMLSALEPTNLVTGGVYNERFMQAAVGGLRRSPIRVGKLVAFDGVKTLAYVEPQGQGIVKFAIGIPSEAFGNGAEQLNTMKINKDKAADPDKDKSKGKAMMEDIDKLESLGNKEAPGPEQLKIDDSQEVGGIRKLVLEWTNSIGELSVDEIKNMFGDGKDLPEPDIIKLETDSESVVRKKGRGTNAVSNVTVKEAYYGPTPEMFTTCPKCGAKMFIDWEKNRKNGETVIKCSNPDCGYEVLYEGSLENQGVAAQKDMEPKKK